MPGYEDITKVFDPGYESIRSGVLGDRYESSGWIGFPIWICIWLVCVFSIREVGTLHDAVVVVWVSQDEMMKKGAASQVVS